MHKNKKLTYILLGVIAAGVLAVSAIFLINRTSSQPEKEPLTTEGLIDQSKRNHQESVAQQLYLTAKLQYIDKGYFPEKLENLTEDIESVKKTLPNLNYTRYGSRGFVITYTNLDGKEERLTYTAEEDQTFIML